MNSLVVSLQINYSQVFNLNFRTLYLTNKFNWSTVTLFN